MLMVELNLNVKITWKRIAPIENKPNKIKLKMLNILN